MLMEQKLLQKEQKKYVNENRVLIDNIIALFFMSLLTAMCGLLRISMVIYGLLWQNIFLNLYRFFSRS